MSGSWSSSYVRFLARRAGIVLLAATVVMAISVVLAARLQLRTSFVELLPSDDPGVVTLAQTQRRMGDLTLLLVGVHSPDRQANVRYAEHLTQKLRALPPEICALATFNVSDVKAFFDRNRWLYLSEEDLTEIRDRLRAEITRRKNPLLVDLGADESVDEMRQRLTSQDRLGGRFPGGLFSNADGTYLWVAALPPGGIVGENAGEALFRAADQIVRQSEPRSFHPEMTAHVGGPVATLIASRQAVERDILWVTLTCAALVALSIGLFFRRVRVVPLIGLPALVGTVMAFAVAERAFGYVNSSTAFLGSIILGNGINYGILLLSRYQEERAAGLESLQALERALDGVVGGTLAAAVCASAAYGSLMLTSFRGFYQFGVMGAAGVLFCWLATFTMLPALFVLLARHGRQATAAVPPRSFGFLGRWLHERSRLLLVGSVVLTAVSIFGLLHFARAPFEYDFRKLNARLATSQRVQDFNRNQDALFGRWPQPTIVLADDRSEVASIEAAIRRQDQALPGPDVIGRIVTIDDVLPGTAEEQRRKLTLLDQIRQLTRDPTLELLTPEERKTLDALEIPDDLRVVTAEELPPIARRPFTEADGTVGRVLLVYPVEQGLSVWNGQDLLRIAQVLQRLELKEEGKVVPTSGSAVVFAAMIRSILRDGPIATVASLGIVLLLTFLTMRPVAGAPDHGLQRPWRAAAAASATLLLGVLWMVGAAGLAEVKITFLNFIALPITFGIGMEYALNVIARYRQGGDMPQAVSLTGSAVALCSWTTIVGYGSLLAARNRALQGFGAMAIAGEVACLLAAVVALPAFVIWRERRAARVRS